MLVHLYFWLMNFTRGMMSFYVLFSLSIFSGKGFRHQKVGAKTPWGIWPVKQIFLLLIYIIYFFRSVEIQFLLPGLPLMIPLSIVIDRLPYLWLFRRRSFFINQCVLIRLIQNLLAFVGSGLSMHL